MSIISKSTNYNIYNSNYDTSSIKCSNLNTKLNIGSSKKVTNKIKRDYILCSDISIIAYETNSSVIKPCPRINMCGFLYNHYMFLIGGMQDKRKNDVWICNLDIKNNFANIKSKNLYPHNIEKNVICNKLSTYSKQNNDQTNYNIEKDISHELNNNFLEKLSLYIYNIEKHEIYSLKNKTKIDKNKISKLEKQCNLAKAAFNLYYILDSTSNLSNNNKLLTKTSKTKLCNNKSIKSKNSNFLIENK